jgi:hypothetical protein
MKVVLIIVLMSHSQLTYHMNSMAECWDTIKNSRIALPPKEDDAILLTCAYE